MFQYPEKRPSSTEWDEWGMIPMRSPAARARRIQPLRAFTILKSWGSMTGAKKAERIAIWVRMKAGVAGLGPWCWSWKAGVTSPPQSLKK